MKVSFASLAIALLNVFSISAATVPLYTSSTPVTSPPDPAPQIDATTWINQTTFEVSDFSTTPLPYQSIRTMNFRNEVNGQMFGHPGYFFEYVSGSIHQRMATWHNRGSISSFPNPASQFFTFTTANWLLVSSDNITNSGLLNASPSGLLRLDGNTINLLRGRLRTGDPIQSFVSGSGGSYLNRTNNYFNDAGIADLYWGTGSNNVVGGTAPLMPLNQGLPNFSTTGLLSPIHEVIELFSGSFLFTNQAILPSFSSLGPKGFLNSVYVSTNQSATQILVQVVFVATNLFDTNLTTDVTFYPNGSSGLAPATVQVGFRTVDHDLALDVDVTNSLYVLDGMALETNVSLIRNAVVPNTRRPLTYEVTTAPFRGSFFGGQGGNSSLTNFPIYRTTYASNAVAPMYAAYSAQLTAQSQTASDPTTLPGRIEVLGQDVNLRDARIRAESTFILTAANLVSNNQARVSAPFLCFDVGTTQPQLLVSNLAPPSVNRLYGTVSAWSGMWDNSDANIPGMTLRFHVLIVDHNLQSAQPVIVSKFLGRAPQIVLHDFLSVNQQLRLETSSLYVKSAGGLSFPPNWSWGKTNMVNIVNYTNEGVVNVPGNAILGSDKGIPYANVINRGSQTAQSQTILAGNFENYGSMVAQGNSFDLTATTAALRGLPFTRQLQIITNIFFFPAPSTNYVTNIFYPGAASLVAKGNLTIHAPTISLSNALLQAGDDSAQGSLVINASTRLTDGGPGVTNYWIASGGIRVPVRPTQFSDLMHTYALIKAPDFSEVVTSWDGKNLSTTVMGYSNNLALGKLTIDGGEGTLFRFVGIPGKDNAIYVDYLELLNNATNFTDPSVFSFDPNIKIYFAHANLGAKKLNGAQNNHIRWVPFFTGPLSTTNIVYPSGTAYPVNISLAQYLDFDSDGDGIPNHKDPTPIYTPESVNLAVERAPTNRVLLSWQALANSVSYVEYKPLLTSSTWQLLRSTTAPANMRISMTDTPLTGRTQRIYRVRVDLPPQ